MCEAPRGGGSVASWVLPSTASTPLRKRAGQYWSILHWRLPDLRFECRTCLNKVATQTGERKNSDAHRRAGREKNILKKSPPPAAPPAPTFPGTHFGRAQ